MRSMSITWGLLIPAWCRAPCILCGGLLTMLVLLSSAPRMGEAFVTSHAGAARMRRGGLVTGLGARRLMASIRSHAFPSSRLRAGRELQMDARSCAPVVTDDNFEAEVLDSNRPVLVFFRAPWCGPCRMVGPVVDEVIYEHGGKLKVCELCTDDNPKTVAEFKIRNIPTLMLFHERKSVMTLVGAVPKSGLVSSIKKHMDL